MIEPRKNYQLYKYKYRKKQHFRSNIIKFILVNSKISDTLFLIIISLIIGFFSGFAGVFFQKFISFIYSTFWYPFANNYNKIPLYYRLLVIMIPAVGGLLVGLITKYIAAETEGIGIPEVMEAVSLKGGIIRPRVIVFKVITSIISLGSGLLLGMVGPIVQIGSAIGSSLGKMFKLSAKRIKILIACGTAAGIAAIFQAPIAGILFSLEIIVGDFTIETFGPVILASFTTSIISKYILGVNPIYQNIIYSTPRFIELPFFVLLGIFSAFIALIFVFSYFRGKEVFANIKFPSALKPALGGIIVGITGFFIPKIFAIDNSYIISAFKASIPIHLMLLYLVLKFICIFFGLGSGGSGGIFSPVLIVGALSGSVFGKLLYFFFPDYFSFSGIYSLIGMTAILTGVTYAPLTAIALIYEMTNNHRLLVPVVITTLTTIFIVRKILPFSIYTWRLKNKGLKIESGRDFQIMDSIKIKDIMQKDYDYIPSAMKIADIIELIMKNNLIVFPVLNSKKEFIGTISLQDIRSLLFEEDIKQIGNTIIAEDIVTKNHITLSDNETLSTAFAKFRFRGVEQLPVLSYQDSTKLVGILSLNFSKIQYQKHLLNYYFYKLFPMLTKKKTKKS